jgi:hypothetical protein
MIKIIPLLDLKNVFLNLNIKYFPFFLTKFIKKYILEQEKLI